ncbi:hypothetical protein [Nocardioides sp. zg-DK7169]|uniref:hypothetical protein n=1 Tax=Nocardioides sp. zg-DK7169 TaxID=2736600 RepID=UPI0015555846|nr:hypothetical protein [Nocardioides sp. zg-DK7169]NPC96518.1 hypothetical protein [Nocardioides sp. zg-DK7169]
MREKPSRRSALIVAALLSTGSVLVILSLLPSPGYDDAWLRDVLMTLGSSVLLFAPFYLLTRSLDSHIEQVREDAADQVQQVRASTAATVEDLSKQVEEVREDVARQLTDVAERVDARLRAEAAADRDTFEGLRSAAPEREVVADALKRAVEQGLVDMDHPPRVAVGDHYLYVSFLLVTRSNLFSGAAHVIELRLERIDGESVAPVVWDGERTAEDILFQLGRELRKETNEAFDTVSLFTGLADLLEVALTSPGRRPAIELCPPQWVVTTGGVHAYGNHFYGVGLAQLQSSSTIGPHVMAKGWVDADSFDAAQYAALSLFPPNADAND